MDKNVKIFVTGHRGMVGSALVRRLEAGCYANIITRSRQELDLLSQTAVQQFLQNEQPDYIFIAAAKVGGIHANNTYRADFIYQNLMIEANLIHGAHLAGVQRLMFLGSSCIYPRDCPQPIKEEYLLTGPLEITNEPYAIAKIAGIKSTESFNLQYGTNFISAMPTNLYGPNDNFDLEKSHVLPAMVRKFLLGNWLGNEDWDAIRHDLDRRPVEGVTGASDKEEILRILSRYGITRGSVEIWGTGKPMREFLWSEDMADACVFLLEKVDFEDLRTDKSQMRNFHINIGTGREISIGDLAALIQEKVKYTGDIVFNTARPDGTMRKLTDTTRIRQLGWTHSVEVEEGIERMIEWYQGS